MFESGWISDSSESNNESQNINIKNDKLLDPELIWNQYNNIATKIHDNNTIKTNNNQSTFNIYQKNISSIYKAKLQRLNSLKLNELKDDSTNKIHNKTNNNNDSKFKFNNSNDNDNESKLNGSIISGVSPFSPSKSKNNNNEIKSNTSIYLENSCQIETHVSSLSSLIFSSPQKNTYFIDFRHLYFNFRDTIKKKRYWCTKWRIKEKERRSMKIKSIIITLCLNIGVDPPDIIRTNPSSQLECWIDPMKLPNSRALKTIGDKLVNQYMQWNPKNSNIKYLQKLDTQPDKIRIICKQIRQESLDKRVIFHYNGHGVPRPTEHGELWYFNDDYTEYMPVSILDITNWLEHPALIIIDCSAAGKIVTHFKIWAEAQKASKNHHYKANKQTNADINNNRQPIRTRSRAISLNTDDDIDEDNDVNDNELYNLDIIILGACDEHEILPMNPNFPRDLFTSCLTTPIKMALNWFIQTCLLKDIKSKLIQLLFDPKIGGKKSDKNSPLGELHWIFLSITDTIAWDILPTKLFQSLFGVDITLGSIFRNYLLAERIMKSMNRTTVSYPKFPSSYQHKMWSAWDTVVDDTLLKIQQYKDKIINKNDDGNKKKIKWKPSRFYDDQLRAFELFINSGHFQLKPKLLPIILQSLLNVRYRVKSLTLLAKYLDTGPWAINYCLWVGIFPYLKMLIKKAMDIKNKDNNKRLRYTLTFIWSKVISHDDSCINDLIDKRNYTFFYNELKNTNNDSKQIYLSTYIICSIINHNKTGQNALLSKFCDGNTGLIKILKKQLKHNDINVKLWSILCIGKLWENHDNIKKIGIKLNILEDLIKLTRHMSPDIRVASLHTLSIFLGPQILVNELPNLDINIGQQCLKLVNDGSGIVRMELVFMLSNLIYYHKPLFKETIRIYKQEQNKRKKQYQKVKLEPIIGNSKSVTTSKSSNNNNSKLTNSRSYENIRNRGTPHGSPLFISDNNTPIPSPIQSPLPNAYNNNNNNNNNDNDNEVINIDKSEYQNRRAIWEVVSLLCKDPTPQICRNANRLRKYMLTDQNKSKRSQALLNPDTTIDILSKQQALTVIDNNKGIFGEYNSNNNISNTPKTSKSVTWSNNSIYHHKYSTTSTYSRNPSPFFAEDSKQDDPEWRVASSPLFKWFCQYITRPLIS